MKWITRPTEGASEIAHVLCWRSAVLGTMPSLAPIQQATPHCIQA